MSVSALELVETLRPDIIDEMVAKRNKGESFDVIAVWLTTEIGHSIGREGVRTWFKAFDARTGAAPVKTVRAKPTDVVKVEVIDDELDGSGYVHDPIDAPETAISDTPDLATTSWHDHKHEYIDRGNGTKKCSCGEIVRS